ncbi:MAG: hydroxyphenylacetyl-CoA thioesterase PaaI [Pseudomonadota bacterium]
MTPQERAETAAARMWANDRASQWLGLTLDRVGPGEAVMSLQVEAHHANGHGICHGGYIFTLADSAFAFACNSFNRLAVAQHNTISFLRPGRVGQRLTATARQTAAQGRSGVYDVEVTAQAGAAGVEAGETGPETGPEIIATFRGVSREIGGTHFDEDAAPEAAPDPAPDHAPQTAEET